VRHNIVKEKLNKGEPAFGVWLSHPTCDRVEFYGRLGFEFVLIDGEHKPVSTAVCLDLVRACDAVDTVPIVRPPNHEASTILGYLETGAMGIYAPHVSSAEVARAVVDAVKYAPVGSRSAGSSERPADYGLTQAPEEYYAQANEETFVALLVEDVEGVSNLDEILTVPGVDAVCIGPGDLALSMGYMEGRAAPEVLEAVLNAEARVAAAGLPFDCEPTNAEEARAAIGRGARLIPFFERNMVGRLFRETLDDLSAHQFV
jgi:4-hydroxy-2-oxoheptanedioate aldolase